ncbi:hypothetical protein RCL_jg4995.t1 [Rhizophagus clarus]|uniref:Uncharacterized protein n=1 Tax=Rhizophagus clarus TaxID=94130 RepID=A0A8H3QMT6_9GLOM|nr:hypothetical protein RCL_jg4995.t1 [Rhizophagus clarus]
MKMFKNKTVKEIYLAPTTWITGSYMLRFQDPEKMIYLPYISVNRMINKTIVPSYGIYTLLGFIYRTFLDASSSRS